MSQTSRFAADMGWQILLKDLGISPAEFLKRARLPGDMFARKDFPNVFTETSELKLFFSSNNSLLSTYLPIPVEHV